MNDSMASVVWKLVTSLIRRQCTGIFKETSDVIHSHYRNSSYQQNSSGSTIYGLPEYHIWITGTLDYRNCVPVTGTVDTAFLLCAKVRNNSVLLLFAISIAFRFVTDSYCDECMRTVYTWELPTSRCNRLLFSNIPTMGDGLNIGPIT